MSEGTLTVEGRLSQPGSECSVLLENQAKPVVPDRDGKFQALFVVMSKPYQYQVEVLCEGEKVFSGVADYPPGSLDVGEVGGRT